MFVDSLQDYLANNPGVKAALGAPSARADGTTGIFPMVALGQPDSPYIVYSQVSGAPQTINFQGTDNLQNARWRFSCHGSTYKQAKVLGKIVCQAMFSLLGTMAAGNAVVQGSWKRSDVDTAEPVAHGTLFTNHVDFEILYVDNDLS